MNDDGTFSYSLNFEGAKYGYTVQARVNMGWCGSGDNWIRFGDYFNDFAHSFEMEHDAREATKDVNLVKYKDPSRPDVDEHLGKLDVGRKRLLSISLNANLYNDAVRSDGSRQFRRATCHCRASSPYRDYGHFQKFASILGIAYILGIHILASYKD